MINHKFDEKLIAQLADSEIKVSELSALCLAKDSEILKLEATVDELNSKIKQLQSTIPTKNVEKLTSGSQTFEKMIDPDMLTSLQSQNFEMAKKIETLEKKLFNSELKCIELNDMIKNCYNEVELFSDNKEKKGSVEPVKNKNRIGSAIDKEFPSLHRSNSQEEDIGKPGQQKLSLMNFINYKSRLGEHCKTPTQKHSVNAFNFPPTIKKKVNSPIPKY
ncbi:hypothetical protein SteCoe_31892 [Stentor coeruleus]|uniref:Uncharacterized protein n=1 Tax=Stentor coeruleus TaxID=5963 RepID=A0A1R2B066_9CILI|nr:hypothetical protein SteCoe_31892 [Stentor coeruleus]